MMLLSVTAALVASTSDAFTGGRPTPWISGTGISNGGKSKPLPKTISFVLQEPEMGTTKTAEVEGEPTTTNKRRKKQNMDDNSPLSEMDARVLESILGDENLDFKTEENLRKLLERGVATPEEEAKRRREQSSKKMEDKYSSKLFQTLSEKFDNQFWNSVGAKAAEFLDSAKLFVANRIERDAKLLASVGLFAIARAKRDAGRALPQAGKAVKKTVRLLASESSFVERAKAVKKAQQKSGKVALSSTFEDLNTPMDEIRSVTESIRDILSGRKVSDAEIMGSNRGLRSMAPAGSSQNAERQRRAYQRRKETVLKREKERVDVKLGRAAGSVTDAAWELKRELEVEVNKPGYRSEPVRKAIGEGAVRALEAAEQRGWRGAGRILEQGRQAEVLGLKEAEAVEDAQVQGLEEEVSNDLTPVLTMEDLLEERARMAASLRLCLEQPDKTWLMPDVVSSHAESVAEFVVDDDSLGDVITDMICTRDDLEADFTLEEDANGEVGATTERIFKELHKMKGEADMITSRAAVAAGYDAAERLSLELHTPLIQRLDEIEEEWREWQKSPSSVNGAKVPFFTKEQTQDAATNGAKGSPFFMKKEEPATSANVVNAQVVEAVVVEPVNGDSRGIINGDQMEEGEVASSFVNGDAEPTRSWSATVSAEDGPTGMWAIDDGVAVETQTTAAVQVEVVSDEVFNEAVMDVKAVEEAPGEEEQEADDKENLLVFLTLRSFDVFFFVLEKTFTAAGGIFRVGRIASSRISKIQKEGRGSEGWEVLANAKDGRQKY